ncbi:MAG: restriction endonuclease [Solirubrobacterales bacterium]
MSSFDLVPGDALPRVELHQRFGGRRQGGISPCKPTPNVFLFTDERTGLLHGYVYDGWRDGLYHYTGEGQVGDQIMAQGNRAIRDHRGTATEQPRELHLFKAANGIATYVGQFEYEDHYLADASESGSDRVRSVYVFRLRPLTAAPGPNRSKVDALGTERVKEIPVEQHLTERTLVAPAAEPHEAERREQALVRRFLAHLLGKGHEVVRLQLRPEDEPAHLFCDLYDKTENTIYEAKGSVARPAIRMAIGQLADYSRLLDPLPRRAILLPQEPRTDLLDLAASQGIDVVWPDGEDFRTQR